jgi:hypothetical protein
MTYSPDNLKQVSIQTLAWKHVTNTEEENTSVAVGLIYRQQYLTFRDGPWLRRSVVIIEFICYSLFFWCYSISLIVFGTRFFLISVFRWWSHRKIPYNVCANLSCLSVRPFFQCPGLTAIFEYFNVLATMKRILIFASDNFNLAKYLLIMSLIWLCDCNFISSYDSIQYKSGASDSWTALCRGYNTALSHLHIRSTNAMATNAVIFTSRLQNIDICIVLYLIKNELLYVHMTTFQNFMTYPVKKIVAHNMKLCNIKQAGRKLCYNVHTGVFKYGIDPNQSMF